MKRRASRRGGIGGPDGWEKRPDGLRTELGNGALVLLEESHDLPMVDLQLTLRTGALHDPRGVEGVTRVAGRMLRMGTKRVDGPLVEETIARLGGRLSIETGSSFVRIHGSVIRRNLEPFLALVAELVREPAFRAADLAQVKRETIADIVAMRDNDRALAARHFRAFLFGTHPYGRTVVGTRASVRAIRREHVRALHERHFCAKNLIFGASGDVRPDEVLALAERHFGDLAKGRPPRDRIPAPKVPRGRRALIVDKPERTQTQLFIGTLGARAGDRDIYPLIVANTAFGGTFTARLMREVRSVRGWSYGASSRVGQDRQRDAWYMWTHPSSKDAVDCARLQLELLDQLIDGGITRDELRFAKDYLTNSHCFDVDTPSKRLDTRVDLELLGLPVDHYTRYLDFIRAVTLDDANAALRRRISPRDVALTIVATAKDLRRPLSTLPNLTSLTTTRYDRD